MVYKKMHLQGNTLYDLDIRVRVTQNVAQYSLHHVTYALITFENISKILVTGPRLVKEMHLKENTFMTLTLGSRSHKKLHSTVPIL